MYTRPGVIVTERRVLLLELDMVERPSLAPGES